MTYLAELGKAWQSLPALGEDNSATFIDLALACPGTGLMEVRVKYTKQEAWPSLPVVLPAVLHSCLNSSSEVKSTWNIG